jgi:hypothetical protein
VNGIPFSRPRSTAHLPAAGLSQVVAERVGLQHEDAQVSVNLDVKSAVEGVAGLHHGCRRAVVELAAIGAVGQEHGAGAEAAALLARRAIAAADDHVRVAGGDVPAGPDEVGAAGMDEELRPVLPDRPARECVRERDRPA